MVRLDGRNGLRKTALAAIDTVEWIPAWGKERIYNMLSVRPDWCISRQRTWGVPITIFYCEACREPYWSRETFDRIIAERDKARGRHMVREGRGLFPAGRMLPAPAANRTFVKEEDILDVWFDSGSSFAAVSRNGRS